MLVSDRAQGLVKLGKPAYMGVCSMPDLFHFQQELSKGIGASIGKAWKKSKQAYQDTKEPVSYTHLTLPTIYSV